VEEGKETSGADDRDLLMSLTLLLWFSVVGSPITAANLTFSKFL